ncbi:MAG: DUF4160 domain-containing protein [Firmicutes bacterium]|nr:DUF4160 domain-containing protein [Bacillota bacterium]
MPIVSSFYGIIIQMFFNENAGHHTPHFHASFAEFEAVYDFDGNKLEGNMPKSKSKLIEAWVELHRDELSASWKASRQGAIIKIEGLR